MSIVREKLDASDLKAQCVCTRPVMGEGDGGEWRKMAELSDRQRRAIEALLTSKSTAEAAAQSGIGARTIERWKRNATFQDEYSAASRARLGETVGRLRVAAGEAVETLRAALQDEVRSNRIRAATVLLDSALKAEVDDLSRRVDVMEQKQRATAALDAVSRHLETFPQGRGQPR